MHKESNNTGDTAAVLVGDLRPYNVLYKIHKLNNMCITKNEILGLKGVIIKFCILE